MVIADARVLKEEFLPRELRHRDGEMEALASALEPLLEDGAPENVLLSGPPGAGKTTVGRATLEQLEGELLDLRSTYINCWEEYNRFRVLYKALEGIGKTLDVHRQSTPKDELLTRLRRADELPYVLVLDEVDQLEEQKVLYDLYTMDHVAIVMIANTEESVFARMDERVRSRLMGARRISFDHYPLAALVDILRDRVEWGLEPGSAEDAVLEEIADRAAGDARMAIGILRSAARGAEEAGEDAITAAHVAEAVPDARKRRRSQSLEKLNAHQEAVYGIVEEAGPITPGELYERYREAVEEPRSRRTVRKYVNKMEHYGLLATAGQRKGKVVRTADA